MTQPNKTHFHLQLLFETRFGWQEVSPILHFPLLEDLSDLVPLKNLPTERGCCQLEFFGEVAAEKLQNEVSRHCVAHERNRPPECLSGRRG